jgi:hypothetical protein
VHVAWSPARARIEVRADVAGQPLPFATGTAPVLDDRGQLQARAAAVAQSVLGPTAELVHTDWDPDGAPVALEFTYATTSRDTSPVFRQRVLAQIDAKLPGDWRDIWDMDHDRVRFEVRAPFPRDIRFPLDRPLAYPELPYAVTEDNRIESWRLGSTNPHALVVGATGTGKTVYIRNLIVAASLLGMPVVICDPKRVEFLDFQDWPNVLLLTDPLDIASGITGGFHEMTARYDTIVAGNARKGSFPKILFVLDEYFVFQTLMGAVWAQMRAADSTLKGREHPCFGHWSQMTVLSRTADFHQVLGIQRPDAQFLTGIVRDSLRNRLSMGPLGREAATMMWDSTRIGTRLPNVQGRATATTSRGPAEVQILRLLAPSDDGYDQDDARVWNEIVRRVHALDWPSDVTEVLDRIRPHAATVAIVKTTGPASASATSSRPGKPSPQTPAPAAPAAPRSAGPASAGTAQLPAEDLAPGDVIVLAGEQPALVEEVLETDDGIEVVCRLQSTDTTRTLVLLPGSTVRVRDDDTPAPAPTPPDADTRTRPAAKTAAATPAAVADAVVAPPDLPAVDDDQDDAAPGPARLERVPAYALEPGDTVYLEDATGIPELVRVDDVTDNGDDSVDLTYQSLESDDAGVTTLDGDTSVQRRRTD